jgi:hypothetical protein
MNSDGTVRFRMIDELLNDVTVDSTAALAPGVWSFVAVTVDREDPAGGRLFVDDVILSFDPTPAMGSLANTDPLHFAHDGGSGVGEDFDGALDEIDLYARALDETEVTAIHEARTSGKCKVIVMLPPVTVVCVTPPGLVDVDADVIHDPNSTGGGSGTFGTFSATVRREPVGTIVGRLTSTVNGPPNPVVLTPQPIQIAAGESAPLRLRMGIPWNLVPGELACYSLTVRHLETGREYVSRAMLLGCQRGTPELRR